MFEFIEMTVKPSERVKQRIAERIAARKCLCCDLPLLKRGLCYKCHYKWRTQRQKLTTRAKRAEFDAKLIRAGKLLEAQAVRDYAATDVFTKVADSVA